MTTFVCPICGFPGLTLPPYRVGGTPSYEFCECCDFQFGVTDGNEHISHPEWRQKWIDDGMRWDWGRSDDERPEGWDPVEQLKNLER